MPIFVDPKTGEQYSNVPDDEAERARSEFGLVTPEEYDRSKKVEQAGEGTSLQTVGEGFQRGVGAQAEAIQGLTGFGTAPGLDEDEKGNKLPGGGLTGLQDAYSPEARLRAEAHPTMAGLGTGIASAPAAGLAGAAAGALGGPALLGAALGGVATEAGVGAVAQEYDDAWLEQRPMQLRNIAANTLMFSGIDFAFRGALHGIGAALGGKKASPIGGRNVVSEAQGAAREMVDPAGARSVGAASASDMAEPFDDAIKQMSDRDAAVLARDGDDHLHLTAQNASESFTRLNDGISESLGTQLKHEDIAQFAAELDDKTIDKQLKWFGDIAKQSDAAAREVAAFAEGNKGALDFGNLGKKAVKTIDDFNRRILNEPDNAARNILGDEYKKRLDALTMSIDGSHTVDSVTRKELKALIAPTREALRKGLENSKYFGGAADLQKAINPGWHQFLEHWPKVQQAVLESTGHVKFDTAGAGRITKESTVDRIMSLFGKDPRTNQEFGRHLSGALEGMQTLIDARQAKGIVRKDGLDAMQADLQNLMEDWNLASTVGVAKNRVAAMKKDPRKWASMALDLGERLPMVGAPIKMARTLGDAFTDLHIQKGTPLANVWDSAYKRYALNPAFQDPSIIRNYPDWIADSLRARGGQVPPGGSGMMGGPGIANAAAPAANDTMRGVAQPSAGYQRAKAIIDKHRGQSGRVTLGGARPPRTRDQVLDRLEKVWSPEEKQVAHGYTHARFYEANEALRGLSEMTPDVKADVDKLNNLFGKAVKNGATFEGTTLRGVGLTADEAAKLDQAGILTTQGFMSSSTDKKVAEQFTNFGSTSERDTPVLFEIEGRTGVPIGRGQAEVVHRPGTQFAVIDKRMHGNVPVYMLREMGMQPGAPSDAILGAVTLSDGSNFTLSDIAKSPMGVVTGAGAAALGAAQLAQPERPPPELQSPTHAYRDALREIDQAGTQQVKAMATEALRKKPPRGKDRDPLSLFTGKRKLQDAVEETRERLDEIAGDPTSLIQQISGSAGDLGKTHPSVYSAVVEKAAQVAVYLQGIIPPRSATTLLDPVGAAPSFDRSWDFAARYVGATQPRVALREVVRGAAPPEMLEAVQQNWPELWDGFRVEMLGQVQRMHSAGRHIPSEKLRRLDSLLGLGGQLDPSATLQVAQHMLAAQDAEAASRQQAGQGANPMPSSGGAGASFRTKLESVNADRMAT